MSAGGNSRRNRANEATEQLRAERRAKGLCELCGEPAMGNRCRKCYRRIEARTQRYVGQPRKGRMPRICEDLIDLGYAGEALGKAIRGFQAVADVDEQNARRRREMLIEHVSQARLAYRFLGEVLERNPA
jgi:hypothetical protein